MRIATAAFALLIMTSFVAADEKGDRERRARAALALAGKPSVVTAPAPRPATKSYPEGYKIATDQEKPLVVFVGCPGKHSVTGAVTASVDNFQDVESPAVVIGYPVKGKVYVHKVIRCPVSDEELNSAIRAASGKITATPIEQAAPAPKPVNWDI